MILNGVVGGKKLGGDIVLVDMSVGSRKRVFPVAKGANPDFGGVIDAGVGVPNDAALGAIHRLVIEDRQLAERHQRSAHYG